MVDELDMVGAVAVVAGADGVAAADVDVGAVVVVVVAVVEAVVVDGVVD